ncbi:MAG: hypothetical protein P8179_19915 [Candidatus Thiodiazotropha sp.]
MKDPALMSHAIEVTKTLPQASISISKPLKYIATATLFLFGLLELNGVVFGFGALLGLLGFSFMERVKEINERPSEITHTIVGERFVDGGVFRETPIRRNRSHCPIVNDGGSFERYKY